MSFSTKLKAIKDELVQAHRSQDWERAKVLSQRRNRIRLLISKLNSCLDCGQPTRGIRCNMHERKRRWGRRIGVALALVYLPTGAATYYLSATGNDSNNGLSTGAPWLTMLHAQTNVAANDTVLFNRGDSFLAHTVAGAAWTNLVDGLTLDAYGSGALPIINGGGSNRWGIIAINTSGSVTRNLDIRNFGGLAPPNDTGANWEADVGTNTITDCIVSNHLSDACIAGGGTGARIVVSNCIIANAFDDGVTLHGTATALVANSTIKNCSQGLNNAGTAMIEVFNDCTFVNNTNDIDSMSLCSSTFNRCIFNGRSDDTPWAFFKESQSNTVFNYCLFDASRTTGGNSAPSFTAGFDTTLNNCVFYGAGNGGIVVNAGITLSATNCIFTDWWRLAFVDSGGSLTLDHCITNSITTGDITVNANKVSGNPLLVSPSTGDFHLQRNSPANNSGVNVGLTTDLAGQTVRNPPEIGVYEYLSLILRLTGQ